MQAPVPAASGALHQLISPQRYPPIKRRYYRHTTTAHAALGHWPHHDSGVAARHRFTPSGKDLLVPARLIMLLKTRRKRKTFLTLKMNTKFRNLGGRASTKMPRPHVRLKTQHRQKMHGHSRPPRPSSLGGTSSRLKSINSSRAFPMHFLTCLLSRLCPLCLTTKHTR